MKKLYYCLLIVMFALIGNQLMDSYHNEFFIKYNKATMQMNDSIDFMVTLDKSYFADTEVFERAVLEWLDQTDSSLILNYADETYRRVYYYGGDYVYESLPLVNDEKIDFKTETEKFYSSDPSRGNTGLLYLEFNNSYDEEYIFEFLPFHCAQKDGIALKNNFIVISPKGTDTNSLLVYLTENIPAARFVGERTRITTGENYTNFSVIDKARTQMLQGMIFLIMCPFVLIWLILVFRENKEISIKKLNGYSSIKILQSIMSQLMASSFVSIFLVLSAVYFLRVGSIHDLSLSLIPRLLRNYFMIVLGLIGGYILVGVYIKVMPVVLAIKNMNFNKMIIKVNWLAKSLLLCFVCVSIIPTTKTMLGDIMNLIEIKEFQNKTTPLAVLNHPLPQYADTITVQYIESYFYMTNQGAIYIDDFNYQKRHIGLAEDKYEWFLDYVIEVNCNYLVYNPVYDLQNKQVLVDQNIDEVVILVPESYYVKDHFYEETITNRYRYQSRVIPIQAGTKTNVYEITSSIVPYTSRLYDEPIIVLIPFSLSLDRGIGATIQYPNLLIPIKDKLNYESEVNHLLEPIGQNDKYKISLYDDMVNQYIEKTSKQLLQIVKDFALFALIIVLFLLQYTYVYVDSNKKELSIKYINGISMSSRYQQLLVEQITTYFIPFLYLVFFAKLSILDSVIAVIVLGIMEVGIALLVIRNFEKKNMVTMLKGEES